MNKIGIATTGGDAPGMNASLRALTRLAINEGLEVIGFKQGWDGLYNNHFEELTKRNVGGILEKGGTILGTSRSDALRTEEGRNIVHSNLIQNEIDAMIIIGGNGSFQAANILSNENDIPFIGVPATIDNDVWATEETIGFDTAINTAVQQIDKIRDTATSHDRIFITEVMGRKHGFIALIVGIAVGAEIIMVPEIPINRKDIYSTIMENKKKGKKSGIIVKAEGVGDCQQLASDIQKNTEANVRINVLGYTQRGGSPSARSRYLANVFSKKTIDVLLKRTGSCVVGLRNGNITATSLQETSQKTKTIDKELLELYKILAI